MNPYEADAYFGHVGVPCAVDHYTGTLAENIYNVKAKININWPFYMTEETVRETCHAVVVRGYDDYYEQFMMRDPNTLNGASTMVWYEAGDLTGFNFEDNVYEYIGGGDEWANGYIFVC